MIKRLLILLFLTTPSWSACPLYTYPENHKLDQELNNICDNISNPIINYSQTSNGTATKFTILSGSATLSGNLTFSTSGNGIVGTTTNDNAAAGKVGEYIQSINNGSNAPSSTHWGDLTSISLTAGDWAVTGGAFWDSGASTWSQAAWGISTTTGDSAAGLNAGENDILLVWANSSTTPLDVTGFVPVYRMSLSGTTTVYLKYKSVYTGGPPTAQGRLSATRVR